MSFMARIKGSLGRFFGSPQELMEAARKEQTPHVKMQVSKRQTRYSYSDGPTHYLAQQVVKLMEDAGFPSKIVYVYRSPEKQAQLYAQGRTAPGPVVTRAKPWSSAHQLADAADICHLSLGWEVPEEYWDTLAACIRTVEERYGVDIIHGHDWDDDGVPVHMDPDERFRDSAHFQLKDWKEHRRRHFERLAYYGEKRRPLNDLELWERFKEVLPGVARDYIRRGGKTPYANSDIRRHG